MQQTKIHRATVSQIVFEALNATKVNKMQPKNNNVRFERYDRVENIRFCRISINASAAERPNKLLARLADSSIAKGIMLGKDITVNLAGGAMTKPCNALGDVIRTVAGTSALIIIISDTRKQVTKTRIIV